MAVTARPVPLRLCPAPKASPQLVSLHPPTLTSPDVCRPPPALRGSPPSHAQPVMRATILHCFPLRCFRLRPRAAGALAGCTPGSEGGNGGKRAGLACGPQPVPPRSSCPSRAAARPCPRGSRAPRSPCGWGSHQPPRKVPRTLLPTRPSCGGGRGHRRPSCPRQLLRGPHSKDAGRTRDACGWRRPHLAVHSQAQSLVECPLSPQAWPAGNPPTLRPLLPQTGRPASPEPPSPGSGHLQVKPGCRAPSSCAQGARLCSPGSPHVSGTEPSHHTSEPGALSRKGSALRSLEDSTLTSWVICCLALHSSAQGHSRGQHRPSWTGPSPDPPLPTWPERRMDGGCPGSGHTEPSLGVGRSSRPPHTPHCPVRHPHASSETLRTSP